MRKIKIIGKGLAKYQQQPGTVTTANKMDIPSFQIPSTSKFIPPPGYLQGMQMTGWTPPQQAPAVGIPAMPTFDQFIERQNKQQYPWAFSQAQKQQILNEQPQAQEKKESNKLMTGPQLAALSVNMLSNVADKLQRSELQKQADQAARSTGQTDAKFPTMRNVYSRGRTPSGYSYSQMVPVQFAGAPAFQPMTFPQFAQDGIEVTRDILQMPTLYTSDPTAPGLYAQDPEIQDAMTRRYADIQLPSDTAPVQSAAVDYTALIAPPVVGPEAPVIEAPSKKVSKEISYSHNNPLNIHYGKFTSKYGAAKGAYDNMGNVAIFPDLNSGIQAAKDLLFSPKSAYYNLRISEARNRWVNGDPDQISESTRHIVKAMGKDAYVSELSATEKDKLLKLFAKWEGKQGYNAIKDMQLFKEGGVYELDDNEIQQILANGGRVEFL